MTMSSQLHTLQQEVGHYDNSLLQNGCLIVANKMDIHCFSDEDEQPNVLGTDFEKEVLVLQKMTPLPIIPISALSLWNIEPLKEALFRIFTKIVHTDNVN